MLFYNCNKFTSFFKWFMFSSLSPSKLYFYQYNFLNFNFSFLQNQNNDNTIFKLELTGHPGEGYSTTVLIGTPPQKVTIYTFYISIDKSTY